MPPSSPAARQSPIIRPIEARDLAEVRAELNTHWHSSQIWSLGRGHQADALPGFVAEINGAFAGLVTINLDPGAWQCEVITLSSRAARRGPQDGPQDGAQRGVKHGAGSALLAAAEEFARAHNCGRIYLTTTNDNTHAIRFYQRRGWRFAALHKGNVDRARALIPEIPLLGFDDIQVRDEIEFERWLA
jgi:GNAT superfamily N-acetyltransferase